MAQSVRWQDPIGQETIKTIVKKIVTTWPDGLQPLQLEMVSTILDGNDILCCIATGFGKSAAFAIPCLVLMEYNSNPSLYHVGLPTRARPIGVVITPTKGLAENIVFELSKLNVAAFSYCHENLTKARKSGIRLAEVIKECIKWQVICVDPEHLRDQEWREITDSPVFRANVLFGCIDEVHLINTWGLSFRVAFTAIGTFLRGRFPSSISVIGLSATLEPGAATASVCQSLGLFEGNFKFIRGSNERPNTQFTVQYTSRGLNGDTFPDLVPYLSSGRKTIIHCRTLDQVARVYAYLWRLQRNSADKLIRTRMYHSINTAAYNAETIRLIDHDPRCQIVISTVAFSNGLNAKSLLDSLSLGFAETFDESWQEKGRVGRIPGTIARGVIIANRSVIKKTQVYLDSLNSPGPSTRQKKLSKKTSKAPQVIDKAKALIIVEKMCYVARINMIYGNPSLDPSRPGLSLIDCISADRPLPCSLCLLRTGRTAHVFPEDFSVFPKLTPPPIHRNTATLLPVKKNDKLSKLERGMAETRLMAFRDSIWQQERHATSNIGSKIKFRPHSSYLPLNLISSVLDKLLAIHSISQIDNLLSSSWSYHTIYREALYGSIADIQRDINAERTKAQDAPNTLHNNTSSRTAPNNPDTSLIQMASGSGHAQTLKRELPSDANCSSVPSKAAKRQRAPRTSQPSVSEVLQDYRPHYQSRRRDPSDRPLENSRLMSLRSNKGAK